MSTREYFQTYYLKNKEKHNNRMKEYYQKHSADILAKRKMTKPYATPKMKAYYKQYAKDHPVSADSKRRSMFKRKYGLSLEKYNYMTEQQSNLCTLCRQPELDKPRLSVDHDHRSGKVRGLLCHNCNVGLGHFRDSIDLLEAAKNYLLNGVTLAYVEPV